MGAGAGTEAWPVLTALRMLLGPLIVFRAPLGPRPRVGPRTGECARLVPIAAADAAARRGVGLLLTRVVLGEVAGTASLAGLLQRQDADNRAAAGARAEPPTGTGRLGAPAESTPAGAVELQRRITSRRSTIAACKLTEREPRRPSSSSHCAMMTFLNISDCACALVRSPRKRATPLSATANSAVSSACLMRKSSSSWRLGPTTTATEAGVDEGLADGPTCTVGAPPASHLGGELVLPVRSGDASRSQKACIIPAGTFACAPAGAKPSSWPVFASSKSRNWLWTTRHVCVCVCSVARFSTSHPCEDALSADALSTDGRRADCSTSSLLHELPHPRSESSTAVATAAAEALAAVEPNAVPKAEEGSPVSNEEDPADEDAAEAAEAQPALVEVDAAPDAPPTSTCGPGMARSVAEDAGRVRGDRGLGIPGSLRGVMRRPVVPTGPCDCSDGAL